MTINKDEQDALLRVARDAIARVIGVPGPDRLRQGYGGPPKPSAKAEGPGPRTGPQMSGAFVSLHIGHELRGCIGYPETDLPLDAVIDRCAAAAATTDTRFPALTAEEWPRVSVEISVLGPIEPVADISEIEVGRHGLIAELGRRRGLLLPQVAAEYGWTREEFLAHTCRKAGLPEDAWQKGATLFRFEAEVFGDP